MTIKYKYYWYRLVSLGLRRMTVQISEMCSDKVLREDTVGCIYGNDADHVYFEHCYSNNRYKAMDKEDAKIRLLKIFEIVEDVPDKTPAISCPYPYAGCPTCQCVQDTRDRLGTNNYPEVLM